MGYYGETSLAERTLVEKWTDYKDFNPDHQPANGGIWIEEREKDIGLVLAVRGLGALLFRAEYDGAGKLDFKGVSEFTEQEIGHRK